MSITANPNATGQLRAVGAGRSIAFVTMGCAKNEVDSRHMAEKLAQAGYLIADDPAIADAVIVNTCSFIQEATEESIEAILDVAGLDSQSRGAAKLVIAGCMPARYADDLSGEFPEAAAFLPCAEEGNVVEVIGDLFGADCVPVGPRDVIVGVQDGSVSAYVKISDGCDRFCSYCTIPLIRGRYHSFPYEDIAAEVGMCVSAGAREVVLIGQDTGRWGDDLGENDSLASLMARLADAFPDTWLRVMYIQPEGVTDELVDVIAAHDNICSYLDIPFQHANERILRSMNRSGSAREFIALADSIRQRIEGVTLRTALIAGFPGETDDDFEELCDFVREAALDYVGVFAYSREESTRAFSLEGQVDEDEKAARAQRLRDVADDVSASVIRGRVGREEPVLVCGVEEDGQLFGRTRQQAPDVDGVTFIDAGEPGQVVRAVIEDTLLYEMEGTVA